MASYSYYKIQVESAEEKLEELLKKRDEMVPGVTDYRILEDIAKKISKQELAVHDKKVRLREAEQRLVESINKLAGETMFLERNIKDDFLLKVIEASKSGYDGAIRSRYDLLAEDLKNQMEYVKSIRKLSKKLQYEVGNEEEAYRLLTSLGEDVLYKVEGLGL